ncbi:transposase [Streptomyces sp. NPDC090442]|uniref:IS66 family transposase n=1 Tax=Streptomyces sp. NPDC090442 TaxID=3365962 RepID=UPI0037F26650
MRTGRTPPPPAPEVTSASTPSATLTASAPLGYRSLSEASSCTAPGHRIHLHQATRALCSAHALRERIAVTNRAGETAHCAAYRASDALLTLKWAADTARETGTGQIDTAVTARQLAGLRIAAADGLEATADRSSKTEAKHHALLNRLTRRWEDSARWVHDLELPFDNNAAEQTSGRRNDGSRSPDACGPCKAPRLRRDPRLPGHRRPPRPENAQHPPSAQPYAANLRHPPLLDPPPHPPPSDQACPARTTYPAAPGTPTVCDNDS